MCRKHLCDKLSPRPLYLSARVSIVAYSPIWENTNVCLIETARVSGHNRVHCTHYKAHIINHQIITWLLISLVCDCLPKKHCFLFGYYLANGNVAVCAAVLLLAIC